MSLFKKIKILLAIFVSVVIVNNVSAQNTVGLILNDDTKSYNGYTLFAPNLSKTTYLIDNSGDFVHQWESDYVPGISAYLLEDGHLLRSAAIKHPTDPENNPTGGFQIIDWVGNLVWEYYHGRQHHDIEYLPNENVLMVVTDRKSADAAILAGRNPSLIDGNVIRSTSILEIAKTGETSGDIVWQWNAWDHLIQEFDDTKDNFGIVANRPELIDINFAKDGSPDWLHTNSVAYNEEFDQIIISNRSNNEIWIIDHSIDPDSTSSHSGGNGGKGGDLLYRWGNPAAYQAGTVEDQKLFGQHDAHWIEPGLEGEGNIMIFNNGWTDREFSSIEEIEPPIDINGRYSLATGTAYNPSTTIWTYTTLVQSDFNSQRFGGSQRLPNGNTLICNAEKGEFFEVTPTEEIVWKYQNPVDGTTIIEQGEQPVGNLQVFRCYKYPLEYSGIKLAVIDEHSVVTNFSLNDNYPNPFNPTTNIEFTLEKQVNVNIRIFDLLGNKIRTLVSDVIEPGVNMVTWDSKDDFGIEASSGVYLYTIQAGQQTQAKKMVLLR